jgi:CheY-like chemotaxis protein
MEKTSDVELIGINDCIAVFQLSIETLRKYKTLGLITPCKKKGKKDLYNKEDVTFAKNFIESLKNQGKSLQEIAEAIKSAKEERNPEGKNVSQKETKKLLIIEDEVFIYNLMFDCLQKYFPKNELSVYYAENGLTGIKQAEKIQPDLIVLDVGLPDITGIEVHERLTSRSHVRNPRFIFMSGKMEYTPENEVFISKPIRIKEFIDTVENLIGLQAAIQVLKN